MNFLKREFRGEFCIPNLLPCPFCNGNAKVGYDSKKVYVFCTECKVNTPKCWDIDTAREIWNKRVKI